METRSNHVLVGTVTLLLLAAIMIAAFWFSRLSQGDNKEYDIFFKQSVSGLAKGSGVNYAGVPSGQVERIELWKRDPSFVKVRISVRDGTPILQGKTATIQGVGFTGVSQVNLDGAVKNAPPITEPGPYGVPVIPTKPGALGELLNSAPELLQRISTLTARLTELLNDKNQKSITGILANVDRLSNDLANRGPEIAAAVVQLKTTMEQAGLAAERVGELAQTTNGVMQSDVRPAMANLNKATASAQHTLETLDAAITDARPGIKAFSSETVPQINQLVRNISEMSDSLNAISSKLDRGGAGAVLGGSKLPDYKPRN